MAPNTPKKKIALPQAKRRHTQSLAANLRNRMEKSRIATFITKLRTAKDELKADLLKQIHGYLDKAEHSVFKRNKVARLKSQTAKLAAPAKK